MGQGKSKFNNTPLYNPAEYTEGNGFNDERYGTMKLWSSNLTQQKYAEISKTLNDESVLEKRVEELNFRKELDHPSIVKLVSFNSQKKDEFCSSFYKLGLFYEYFSNNLRTEISERQKVRAFYKEGELWYILDTLLNVVFYLKSKNVNHGDIRPYNVIITPEGQVKLGEIFIHVQPLSSYSQLLNNSLEEYYISPQLFRCLKEFNASPVFDANKSDIYSIGMTVLEAATLENVSRLCYDQQNYVIKTDEVNKLLSQVRAQHSLPLYSFLQKLLTEDETLRPSVEVLFDELNQQYVQSNNTHGLTTIEIISNQVSQIQGQGGYIQETYEDKEVVQRSANPARQSYTQEKTYEAPITYTSTTYTTQTPVIETTNYNNDDLNARIQAVLAMSRETIAKYGSSSLNYTSAPANYTTTTYTTSAVPTYTATYTAPIDAKASQIETRTFLNENTNNIETKSYQQEPIEEVIKRSKKETAEVPAAQTTTYTTTYNLPSATVEPIKSSQYQTTSYTTSTPIQYNFTSTNVQQPQQTEVNYSNTYVPYQRVDQSSYTTTLAASSIPAQQVTEYQTSSNISFMSPEQRDAYIAKILSESKNYAASNTNTTITYTNYVDGKPNAQVAQY
ncbi:hypothetical protein ABPG72_008320 [Tetrahymena utriculariae]